ncbi:MAG: alpha/beta fold hydrolase [Candidatus Hodarchaeota archaeon]
MITFQGFLWFLKFNWFGLVLVGSFGLGFLILADLSFVMLFKTYWFTLDWWVYTLMFLVGIRVGMILERKLFYSNRKFNEDGDIELLGNTKVTHHFVEVDGIKWHYVEAGEGEPIVFLHGVPESWYTWHNQLKDLANSFHVFAFDLKGYGQSDKSTGDYRQEGVAEELLAVLDEIGLERFNLVGHDRGSVIGDYLGGNHPKRILRYVRGQQILHKWETNRSPQETMFIRPIFGMWINSNPRLMIPFAYARWYTFSKVKIPKKVIKRTIFEYSYPKIGWAVPRYFRSSSFRKEMHDRVTRLCQAMDFPVLLLEASLDPFQPPYYYEGGTELFPDAQLKFVPEASHFWTLEKPNIVTQIIKDFLSKKQ